MNNIGLQVLLIAVPVKGRNVEPQIQDNGKLLQIKLPFAVISVFASDALSCTLPLPRVPSSGGRRGFIGL